MKREELTDLASPLARSGPLTAGMLRTFPGLENLSDTEAEEIISTLRALSKLLLCNDPEIVASRQKQYDNGKRKEK